VSQGTVDALLMTTSVWLRRQANEPDTEELHAKKQLVRRSRPAQRLWEEVGRWCVVVTCDTQRFNRVQVPMRFGKSWKVLDFSLKFSGPGRSWRMSLVLGNPGN